MDNDRTFIGFIRIFTGFFATGVGLIPFLENPFPVAIGWCCVMASGAIMTWDLHSTVNSFDDNQIQYRLPLYGVIPEFLGEKDKVLIYADAAVTISPSAPQLAEIAITTAMNAKKLLGIEPKVAMLSFSTKGSASHSDVDKVKEATKIARQKGPALNIDGELQVDSALVPKVAEKKVKESNVAGKANVLIFPDLDAANIAYKLTQYIGGAKAYGPILQGFRKPINDLSRGASAEDVVGVSAITAVRS